MMRQTAFVGMTTPVDSAHLLLRLFELRREPGLQRASAWFIGEFNPSSAEELVAFGAGPQEPRIRLVLEYWEMAASLVTHGAVDAEMFVDASQDMLTVFAKVEPFLAELRRDSPDLLRHLEAVVRSIRGSSERVVALRERSRASSVATADNRSRVRVVARLSARTEHVAEVRSLLAALVTATRGESGCVSYELLHNSTDPADFTIVGEWADAAALEAHAASPHFADTSARLPLLLSSPADIRHYSVVL